MPIVPRLSLGMIVLGHLAGPLWGQTPPAVIPAPGASASELTVKLVSGRKFTGQVDARTSDKTLVLRFTAGSAVLRRPIEWNRIVAATQNGVAVDLAQLRTLAEQIKTEEPGVRGQESGTRQQEPAVQPVAVPKVATVTFDARLANWDGDVETDGLLVDVVPLDRDQAATPVSGTVEIELFAPPRRLSHDTPHAGEDTLVLVERWTRTIRPADFGPSGARLRLPFGAVHPEFNGDVLNYGLVHVRLVAPGQGVFDDTRDGIRIRPWSPNRDQLEINTGGRFLPTERVGR